MNKFIKFFQWLDSNRVTLVSEVTTLPTEPQPLPEVIKLFVYRSSLRRALEHFARIPWVSIFIFDQLKVVVYPTPRRPSAPSHSKATIGAMHILSFITQNQLIIFTSNSKVDNIEVLSRVQSYLVLIHHTYDLTSYQLPTYLPPEQLRLFILCFLFSVTRLGDFSKFLAKVAKNFSKNFGLLWKMAFYLKLLFGQLLEKIGLFFTPTSGHTDFVALLLNAYFILSCRSKVPALSSYQLYYYGYMLCFISATF